MSVVITPSQTCGPLFGFSMLPEGIDRSLEREDPRAWLIEGAITDSVGQGLGFDAFVELWSPGQACRARTFDGTWQVVMARPVQDAGRDGPVHAPHLHMFIHARGLTRHLYTRLYFPEDTRALAQDPVLSLLPEARRHTLIAACTGERRLRFDIRLQGPEETVFFDTRL